MSTDGLPGGDRGPDAAPEDGSPGLGPDGKPTPDDSPARGASAADAAPAGGSGAAEDRAASRREHAVRGTLAAALILEGITVLFVPQTIAAINADGLGGRRLALLLVLAAALFVAAGIQRRPAGLLVGSVLQVAVILTGLLAGAMYFLGLLFAAVWGFLLWVRQEVARAAARQAGPPPV